MRDDHVRNLDRIDDSPELILLLVAKVCNILVRDINFFVRDIKSQLPLDYSIQGNVTLSCMASYGFKGLINLAMVGPQEIFKQHLIKKEEQPFFSKIYSAHFGEVSTM